MGFRIARFVMILICRLFTRLEIHGLENKPAQGAYIIASNHLGRLDIPLVYYLLDRDDVILMVAEKYRQVPVVNWVFDQLNAIWVDRFNADFGALRACLARLKKGEVLALAPEGTRSKVESLLEARPGTGYLASKAGVPIIPVALTGTEDRLVKQQFKHLRRPRVVITIGQGFTLPPVPAQDRDAAMQQYTDEIMCRIAALLPAQYRGVYADHPRLKELLAGEPGTLPG